MTREVQNIDLMSILLGAQKLAQGKMAMDQMRYERDKEADAQALMLKTRESLTKALLARDNKNRTPEMDQLTAVNPEAALGLEKEFRAQEDQARQEEAFALEQEAKKIKMQKAQAAEYGKAVKSTIGGAIVGTPEGPVVDQKKLANGIFQLRTFAAKGLIPQEPVVDILNQYKQAMDSGEPITPDLLAPILQEADMVTQAWGDPEKIDLGTGIEREAAASLSREKGDPQFRSIEFATMNDPEGLRRHVELIQQQEAARAETAAKGRQISITNVMPGNVEPTKQMEGQLQQELEMLRGVNQSAKVLKDMMTKDLFGYKSKVKEWKAVVLDKVNSDWVSNKDQNFLRKKQAIITNGTVMLYDFILAMSGKAVTDKERTMILSAIGDPASMSFNQYAGTLDAVIDMTDRKMKSKQDTLREGIDVVTSPEERRFIDTKMVSIARRVKSGEITPEQAQSEMADLNNTWRVIYSNAMRRAEAAQKKEGTTTGPDINKVMERLKSGQGTPEDEKLAEEYLKGQ